MASMSSPPHLLDLLAVPGSEVRIIVPEPHYTLFEATREGLPEVIVVNDALLAFAHAEIFPWHLKVTLAARELIENGMPFEPESKLLFEIGDQIEAAVLAGRTNHGGVNALFLARSTWNELRELRYQVHDPKIAHSALQALLNGRTWERPWEYEMEHDGEWEKAGHVFQLFPQAHGRNG
jgi:hypothetical protein